MATLATPCSSADDGATETSPLLVQTEALPETVLGFGISYSPFQTRTTSLRRQLPNDPADSEGDIEYLEEALLYNREGMRYNYTETCVSGINHVSKFSVRQPGNKLMIHFVLYVLWRPWQIFLHLQRNWYYSQLLL